MREKLKVLDLFSGIGGFSLGLERTGGFETIAFCEIDNYCQRVLRKHWPDVFIHSDIRKLGRQHFEGWQWPDVICGGFPCQDISGAGLRVGIDGKRSGLWREMFRVISEIRPSIVIVENVADLLVRGLGRVLGDLASIGYDCEWDSLRAHDFGAPHLRERVFIVAHPRQLDGPSRLESDNRGTNTCRQSIPQKRSPHRLFTELGAEISAAVEAWESREPAMARMANGIPKRVDRASALGNAIVPTISEHIGHCILRASALPEAVAPRAFGAEKRPDKTKNVSEGE